MDGVRQVRKSSKRTVRMHLSLTSADNAVNKCMTMTAPQTLSGMLVSRNMLVKVSVILVDISKKTKKKQ
jgi:hypothetical protein